MVFHFDESDNIVCILSIFSGFAGRGGQSALRFARLRMEKRHNYVRKVAETAVQLYIANDKVSDKFKFSNTHTPKISFENSNKISIVPFKWGCQWGLLINV